MVEGERAADLESASGPLRIELQLPPLRPRQENHPLLASLGAN